MVLKKKYNKFIEKFKIALFKVMFRLTLRTHAFTKGIFFVKGYIHENYIEDLKEAILFYVLKNPKKEIFILIDSRGGNIRDAMYFYDLIKSLNIKTTAIVMGKCYSAGLIILASCDRRISLKHSDFLFHEITSRMSFDDFCNKEDRISIEIEKHEELCEFIYELHQKDFSLDIETIKRLSYNGKYYDKKIFADEALKLGVIHEIIYKLPFSI